MVATADEYISHVV